VWLDTGGCRIVHVRGVALQKEEAMGEKEQVGDLEAGPSEHEDGKVGTVRVRDRVRDIMGG